jgi:hypothetical protein
MTDQAVGHVDPLFPDANNCLAQTEHWSFTKKGGKGQGSFTATTVGDMICFNADFTVGTETSDFTITGGTGALTAASGFGHLTLTVLGHPQKGSGTVTGTMFLP